MSVMLPETRDQGLYQINIPVTLATATNYTQPITFGTAAFCLNSTSSLTDNIGLYAPVVNGGYWYQSGTTSGANLTIQVTGNVFDVTGPAGFNWWENGRQLTSEELAARSRQREKELAVQRKASKRGRKLLMALLTDEQLREYASTRTFRVVAQDGRVFRLRRQKTVEEVGWDGKADASYCIHFPYGYCPEDTLIAQKLLLETDIAEFLRVANKTTHRVSRTPDGAIVTPGGVELAPVVPLRQAA